MEGRDIGTVVFPDAKVKIYLDAEPDARAQRRASELGAAVEDAARDLMLATAGIATAWRLRSPVAPDAEYLDTTHLTQAQVEEAVLKLVRDRTSNGKGHK